MKSNIKHRIFIFNAINIIAVVLTIAGVSGILYKKTITEKTLLFQERETTLVSNNIDLLVTTINDYVNSACVDNTLLDILRNYNEDMLIPTEQYNIGQQLLQTIYSKTALNSYIDSVAIVSTNNSIIEMDSYSKESFRKILESEFPDLSTLKQTPQWHGPVELENIIGKKNNVFIVAKPIYDTFSPRLLGYMFAIINEKDFSEFYHNIMNEPIELYIVNQNNEIVSAYDKSCLHKNIDTLKNSPYTILTKKIASVGWSVVNYIPLYYLSEGIGKITLLLIVIGSITIMLSFFWSYKTANKVTKPIYQLASTMKNCDLLVTNEYIDESESLEELNLLNHRFNQLIARIQDLLAQIEAKNKQKRKYEFSLLQAQIQPHFLYNSLETIISLIGISMDKKAIEYTKNLGTFYRISLSNGQEIITVAEELELIKSYLCMQQMRYVDKMEYTIEEDPQINQCMIPKLTLQPIVENAIYHGIKPAKKKSLLSIKCVKAKTDILITVHDTGVGIPEDKLPFILENTERENTHGFGLSSIDHRLKLFFGDNYGIFINSKYGSFTDVTIKIPFEVQHVKNIDY